MTLTIEFALDTEDVVWVEPDLVIDVGTVPNGGGDWSAFVTTRDGDVIGALGRVNIGDIDRALDEKPTVTIAVPKSSPMLAELRRWEREVQVFRSGDLRFCGPVVSRRGGTSTGAVAVTCHGVRAYLEKRLYPSLLNPSLPWRRNWIRNPRFDDDLDRWTYFGGVTVDNVHETGSQAALLTGSASLSAMVALPLTIDVTAVVDVRVKLSESTPDGGGLWVEVPGVDTGDGWGVAPITSATPRGEWTTLRVVIFIRGGPAGRTVNVTFSAVDAVDGVWVDRASLTLLPPDIIRSEIDEADQTPRHITMSDLIQATGSGLNLGVDSLAAAYLPFNGWHDRYVDEIIALMSENTTRTDVDIVCTPRTRTVRSWTPRGSTFDAAALTLRNTPGVGTDLPRGNVSGFTWDEDGSADRTSMTTVGDDGYGGTFQDSDLLGGLLLEDLQTAPLGTPLEVLEVLSQRAVEETAMVVPLTVTTCDPGLFSRIDLGDVVPVDLVDGTLSFTGPRRITNIVERPATDTMVLTMIEVAE